MMPEPAWVGGKAHDILIWTFLVFLDLEFIAGSYAAYGDWLRGGSVFFAPIAGLMGVAGFWIGAVLYKEATA